MDRSIPISTAKVDTAAIAAAKGGGPARISAAGLRQGIWATFQHAARRGAGMNVVRGAGAGAIAGGVGRGPAGVGGIGTGAVGGAAKGPGGLGARAVLVALAGLAVEPERAPVAQGASAVVPAKGPATILPVEPKVRAGQERGQAATSPVVAKAPAVRGKSVRGRATAGRTPAIEPRMPGTVLRMPAIGPRISAAAATARAEHSQQHSEQSQQLVRQPQQLVQPRLVG